MTEQRRLYALISVMAVVSLVVGGIAIHVLYRAAMEEERDRLMESAQSQARLIEAVARFDAVHSRNYPEGPLAATISQIVDAHESFKGVGETGEFTLARREGDQIVFLLSHRHYDMDHPQPVPWDSHLAEPMRRALSGQSGTVIAVDYRGASVLAAHEPVAELDLGIVAKIDLAEVREPFLKAGLFAFGSAALLICLASVLFLRISNPMLARIEEQHASLHAVLDTAVDGIITIDDEGIIGAFNQAAERIFGHAAEDVIGQNVRILMPASDRDEHDYLADYLQSGHTQIIGVGREVMAARSDGSVFPMDLAVSEVRVGGRRLFTGIVRDITDRKRAEQNTRLAEMGQVLSTIAHESRNALQRIQSSVEILRMDFAEQPDLVGHLDRIENANNDLTRLYKELREYAAPIHLNRETCDLREIWRLAWTNLGHVRQDREAEIHEETNGLDLRLPLDTFRLEQVFRNLMENALEACSDPTRIEIMCENGHSTGAPAVFIRVRDNGPGLTDEQKSRIFEPFFTTKSRGTGLGMAIAQRIIEAHGGVIAVSDAPDRGAEFVITLPREVHGQAVAYRDR